MTADFTATRALFDLPEGVIYLDGNSLGPLPRAVGPHLAQVIGTQWGQHLITGWNVDGWMEQPLRVGNMIAPLIGAPEGSVVMGDTLSIKVYQALASAFEMNPTRKVVLSDTGNFPSDLYIAQGLCRTLGPGYELKTVAPEDVLGALDDAVAVMMITEVDYRTGRRHDMPALTARAHHEAALGVALHERLAGGAAELHLGEAPHHALGGGLGQRLGFGRVGRPLPSGRYVYVGGPPHGLYQHRLGEFLYV